jgi:hypothetical protein
MFDGFFSSSPGRVKVKEEIIFMTASLQCSERPLSFASGLSQIVSDFPLQ